jgi:hypothetical protein
LEEELGRNIKVFGLTYEKDNEEMRDLYESF